MSAYKTTSLPHSPIHDMSLSIARFATVVTLGLALTSPARAQTTAGVRGTVTAAETRRPLYGARVSVEQPARVAVTDERGAYRLRDLPAGSYVVTVSALGRKPSRSTVQLTAGQSATLDVTLEQGSLLLSSIVTSATRIPTDANKVAATVNVLTPFQIRTSPAREAQDLLRE